MTKRTCIIIGLVVSIVSALAFFFYPLHSSWIGNVNVVGILDRAGNPGGLLVFGCVVYVLACILMVAGVIKADNGNVEVAGNLFILSVILSVLFPIFGLIQIHNRWESNLLNEEYAGILLVLAIIQIILIVVYYQLKDVRTGTVKPAVASEPEQPAEVTEEDREEYVTVLSLKSDDELKALVREEKMYDPAFVALAREELMERVVGKRCQRNEEDIRREQEEKQQQAEQQRQEEERLRLQQEEEQHRQEEIRMQEEKVWQAQQEKTKHDGRIILIITGLVLLLIVIGILGNINK